MHKREWLGRSGLLFAVLGFLAGPAAAQDLPPPAARIQRQAENPLRWIIEAGKLKARTKPAVPLAAARPATPKAAVRTAAATPARAAAPMAAAALPVLPPPAAPVDTVPAPAPGTDAPAQPADRPTAAAPEELALLEGDEPSLPDAVDAALQGDAVLELAIIVLADGAVGAVSVVSSSHPAVDEHAVAAVRGWRFKPVAQAQVRSVELVFHPRR